MSWLRFIRWCASKLPSRRIEGEDRTLYLERYRVFASRWFCVYLHRFARADLDEAPHSHPWRWAFSLILAGGYIEQVVTCYYCFVAGDTIHQRSLSRRRRAGSFALLRDDTYHRVDELLAETWTLFVVGPRIGTWHFLVPHRGPIDWRERLAEKGITT